MSRHQINARVFVFVLQCVAGTVLTAVILLCQVSPA